MKSKQGALTHKASVISELLALRASGHYIFIGGS